MQQHQNEIETAFQFPLVWDFVEDRRRQVIWTYIEDVDRESEESLEKGRRWAVTAVRELESVLKPYFESAARQVKDHNGL